MTFELGEVIEDAYRRFTMKLRACAKAKSYELHLCLAWKSVPGRVFAFNRFLLHSLANVKKCLESFLRGLVCSNDLDQFHLWSD